MVEDDLGIPDELMALLLLNRNNNSSEAARLKMIDAHFNDENGVNMEPFASMDLSLMPRALAWMGGDANGRSFLMYELLRIMPSFSRGSIRGSRSSCHLG